MAFSSHDEAASAVSAGANGAGAPGDGDWLEPAHAARDWKKLVLVAGLGILSWVATYVGMLELIEANMGELPLIHKAIIGFSVAMLMIMIIWLLDQLFAPISLFTKLCYAGGYVFLSIISIGFGFGFYWKVLESRSEASRSAESAVGQVQTSLHAASTRLEQLQGTLVQLTQISQQKAETERASGLSCPNSRPGDGPRRKMREDDAARFTFASEFVKGRVGAVKADMATLDTEFARIAKDDKGTVDGKTGTRNEFMKGLSRRLDMTVTGFNAFRTDPQLKQIRADLAERAERVSFLDTKGAAYTCPDPQLQTALRGVVRAIDQLPELEKPRIAAVEGSEATIEAFRRLTATFYGALSFKMPPSADELRTLQQKAVQSVEQGGQAAAARHTALAEQAGLSKRDYVPLAIAIFVDLCLLLVSMGRPVNRLNNLVPKMREAERGPVYQILSKFNDIHRDEETREKFEIFRHVVFDFNGDYYVAVPLDAPYRMRGKRGEPGRTREYTREVADLQLEAHLLANLFASFEKERIFTRVYSPFLTTGTIQKKLWRQGSKFAGSEAFRVYRFRDGAWSEIILGAVMGAARRVDAEKRRRRREERHSLPVPAETSGRPAETPAARPQQDQRQQPAGRDDETPAHARDGYAFGTVGRTGGRQVEHATRSKTTRPEPAQRGATVAEDVAALADKFGPYARSFAAGAGEAVAELNRQRPAPSANYRDMAEAMASVAAARQHVREAEVSVRAANNNTAPPADRIRSTEMPPVVPVELHGRGEPTAAAPMPQNVVPLPRIVTQRAAEEPTMAMQLAASQGAMAAEVVVAMPQTTDQPPFASPPAGMIDVTVRRETATFSVPVSEARLPQSLAQLIGQAVIAGQAAHKIETPAPAPRAEIASSVIEVNVPQEEDAARPAPVILLPPPLPAASDTGAAPERRHAFEPAE